MRPALFLDRDGVIIENNPHYIRSWEDVLFIPRALKALSRLSHSSFKIFLITNQSVIGRGLASRNVIEDINRRLLDEINIAGGRIDGVYMCPHRPEDMCQCRKPKPGLLIQAARDYELDFQFSLLIGDSLSDIEAGKALSLREVILVRTGRGANQEKLPNASLLHPFLVYDSLFDALPYLLEFEATVANDGG